MKIIILLSVLQMLNLSVNATSRLLIDSTVQGIHFEHGFTFKQIVERAKSQGKYIFIDCFTTWCGPCRKMENEVYSAQRVGKYFNDKFISIKIQMDTAKIDNDEIRSTYKDARYLERTYKIEGYPTFLFFSPDGKILNKIIGFQNVECFLNLAANIFDPKKDYYKLMSKYKEGKRDSSEMKYLARTSIEVLNDTALSEEIAESYLLKLKKDEWFTKDNLEFTTQFTKKSNDIGFHLFYQYTDTINKIMAEDNYAERFVHSIIFNEMIVPELEQAKQSRLAPDWEALLMKIGKMHNNYYAERAVLAGKLNWEHECKNWGRYIEYYIAFVEKYDSIRNDIIPKGIEDLFLNNRAWEVFKYSNDKEYLIKALQWSNRAMMMNPIGSWMDTYANILYKLGYLNLALAWEEIAVKQNPGDEEVQLDLEKMKKREPTWPILLNQ